MGAMRLPVYFFRACRRTAFGVTGTGVGVGGVRRRLVATRVSNSFSAQAQFIAALALKFQRPRRLANFEVDGAGGVRRFDRSDQFVDQHDFRVVFGDG